MPCCVLPERSFTVGDQKQDQALCEDQGGEVKPGPCSAGIETRCGGNSIMMAHATQIDEKAFHDSFREITFSQPRLLRYLYLENSDIGRELIRINYSVIPEKALPIITSDQALLEEAAYLAVLACHFANAIVSCKLSTGDIKKKYKDKIAKEIISPKEFTQKNYVKYARFFEELRSRTSDSDLQNSIDFLLEFLKRLVGRSIPELLYFLEESTMRETNLTSKPEG